MSRAATCNYPLNTWWVAATAAEVGRQPLGRWLLDRPVVLYRTEAGAVVALDDRCIHRWAPLSLGSLDGDELVCGYHGARFSPDGRCRRFPTQPEVPEAARVRAYALQERGPFVWIWLGDEAQAASAPLPADLAWACDARWTVLRGSVPLNANYMLFHENVLDLTHFNYLHRHSFGITRWQPPVFSTDGDQVRSRLVYEAAQLSPDERAQLQWDAHMQRQEVDAAFVSPAMHLARTIKQRQPGGALPPREESFIAHCVTPQSAGRTHYWWLWGVDALLPPPMADAIQAMIDKAFAEDKVMLDAIEQLIHRDVRGRDHPEFSFVGDSGGVMARRVLARLLAREVVA